MNTAALSEVSHDIPIDIPRRLTRGGEPLLTAYGCVLLERDTGGGYVYSAVNHKTGRTAVLTRRANPLTDAGVAAMVEKIRLSPVAGAGAMEVDRTFGESLKLGKLREIQDAIFRDILPQHGYGVREQQIELANHILDTIVGRRLTLAEAEVGAGKTLAYLVAAILIKRGRANDFWNMGFYPTMNYVDMAHMPVVISTSSIALQKAILQDYIPELSNILMAHGIIRKPLTAVIRKGKEHYVCEHKLRAHIPFEYHKKMEHRLKQMLEPSAPIDLAEIDGLTPYIRRRICVPDRCPPNCPQRSECRYLCFLDEARSSETDIQVCNHNYILADTKRRSEGKNPLIPNYQCLIIDEAHRFLQAARQMYGIELSSQSFQELMEDVNAIQFLSDDLAKPIRGKAQKLSRYGGGLFRLLNDAVTPDDSEDEADRRAALMTGDVIGQLRKVQDAAKRLSRLITLERANGDDNGKRQQVLWELEQISNTITALLDHDDLIYWLEDDGAAGATKLYGVPSDLDERLFKDLWFKGIPTILTSGTLSAGAGPSGAADFTHIKRTLGLERAGIRLTETSKPSPFNHRDNALLYISENIPFPDNKRTEYIDAIADETERLILAAHGHTAVLFTSYKVMDMVHERLAARELPFPLFRLDRKGVNAIEKFKQSGNGVLFASGAMWEGVDIPGDALSLLIIVKLPFAVPDPIGEYERTLYADLDEYKRRVIVPDMLIKLKQGFGRLIRTEKDTGAVAILDIRAGKGGAYRGRVLAALPPCKVTSDIWDVEAFMRDIKPVAYFQ